MNLYLDFLDFYSLLTELNLGKRNWSDTPERPTEVLEVYSNSSQNSFYNILFLLKVLMTLPVSTATPERIFSSLKDLRTICEILPQIQTNRF